MLCRVCLSCDAQHDIYSTRLHDVFERLTSIQMYSGDGKPHSVCALCLALLRKSHQLWRRALTADRLLERLLKDGHLINENSVQDSDRQQYSLTYDLVMTRPDFFSSNIHVKMEPVELEESIIPSPGSDFQLDTKSTAPISKSENRDDDELNSPGTDLVDGTDQQLISHSYDLVVPKSEIIVYYCNLKEVPANSEEGDFPSTSSGLNYGISRSTSLVSKCINEKSLKSSRNLYVCNECGKKFKTKIGLIKHIKCHHLLKTRQYTPKEGNIEFGDSYIQEPPEAQSDSHLLNSKSKYHVCLKCKYKTCDISNFNIHLRQHTMKKRFKCNFCKYTSNAKHNFVTHIRKHTGEKPYQCSVCEYKSPRKYSLQVHLRTHSGEMPYNCNVCKYKSSSKTSFVTHMRIHTGEKPFRCSICKYKSSDRRNLIRHTKIHTKEM